MYWTANQATVHSGLKNKWDEEKDIWKSVGFWIPLVLLQSEDSLIMKEAQTDFVKFAHAFIV